MEGHLAYSPLPALLVLVPALAAALVPFLGRLSETVRDWYATVVTAITFLGAVALIPQIAEHHRIGCTLPGLFGELTFEVDPFGMLFALFTSFVWMLATLYAGDYMQHEKKRDRYHVFNLIVLAANLGVVLAGDLITLYLFFEALGLTSYMMVVHTETPEAKKASVKYLWMNLVGGFSLVAGIFLVYAMGSGGTIGPFGAEEAAEVMRWSAAGLMILGFGVKAGMLPVHVWLPEAHPVAPSPASALLSGVMIKAGAYGIFRVVTAIFRPPVVEELSEGLWHFAGQLGHAVLWIGIATMFVGVVLALLQENAKRMLAYHSVSQMGFILAGIGAAGYLGAHGAMGFAGGLYHIVNHALFKGLLFLGVGAVFFRTRELNMYKLGGLWKKMPLTFIFTLVAAFGITGVPLFNGFVSKCLIHHALVESIEHAEHLAHAAEAMVPAWHAGALSFAEKIYIVTCGGTAASFIKLILFVFLGKEKTDLGEVREAPPRMLVAMGILAVPLVVLGLWPQLLLEGIFVPGLHVWGLHGDILEEFVLFTGENLASVAWAFGIGITIVVVGIKTGAFHAHFPEWFSVDYFYRQGARLSRQGAVAMDRGYAAYLDAASVAVNDTRTTLRAGLDHASRSWRRSIVTLGTGASGLRHQRFIDSAYIVMDDERHATVRKAVTDALHVAQNREDMHDEERRMFIDSVRDLSSYMAGRLFRERMDVLTRLVKRGRVEPIEAAMSRVMPELSEFRERIARVALEYAEPRMKGENVIRSVSHQMNVIMSEERFDRRIRRSIPTWQPDSREVVPAEVSRLSAYHHENLTMVERLGRWVSDLGRVVGESVTQERIPWMIEEHVSDESRTALRLAVQRYARDIGLNVGIVVAVLLLFVYALLA